MLRFGWCTSKYTCSAMYRLGERDSVDGCVCCCCRQFESACCGRRGRRKTPGRAGVARCCCEPGWGLPSFPSDCGARATSGCLASIDWIVSSTQRFGGFYLRVNTYSTASLTMRKNIDHALPCIQTGDYYCCCSLCVSRWGRECCRPLFAALDDVVHAAGLSFGDLRPSSARTCTPVVLVGRARTRSSQGR